MKKSLKEKKTLNSQLLSPYNNNNIPKKIKKENSSIPEAGSRKEEADNPPKKEKINKRKPNPNPEHSSILKQTPPPPPPSQPQSENNENLPNFILRSSPPKKKQKPLLSKTPTYKTPAPTDKSRAKMVLPDSETEEVNLNNNSVSKPKSIRKPLQPINITPRMSALFDDSEGIPIVQAKEDKGTVFLGNSDVAQNLDWLKESNIKAIVNASSEIKNFYPDRFIYKKFPIIDSEDCKISKYFDEVSDFINEHRTSGSVLVHCQKGQSRSVTLMYAYLIKNEGMTLSEVCDFFESNRIKTTMNIGFQQQIMIWEKKITKKNTKDFFARTPRIRRTPLKYSPRNGKTYSRLGYAEN